MPNQDASFVEDRAADSAADRLAERVRAALTAPANGATRIVQVRVPLRNSTDPIEWVRAQPAAERVFWAPRTPGATVSRASTTGDPHSPDLNEPRSIAAIGAADVLTGDRQPMEYGELHQVLQERFRGAEAPIRYYGGLRFDAPQSRTTDTPDHPWVPFGTFRFILPRFELRQEGDERVICCNLVRPRDEGQADALVDQARQLTFSAVGTPPSLPTPFGRRDHPEKEGWTQMLNWALEAIRKGSLSKVVLARMVALELGTSLDPFDVLHHLKTATPGCFHFALSPADGSTFLGASPERLFRRRGRQVESEAVAGTGERGDTPEADAALWDELLNSPKERREHAFVQRAIRKELEQLCASVQVPDTPSDLALTRGRHLHARLSGTLRSDVSTTDLLDRLHPTPAVGGVPTEEALTAIRTQEPFDRGWYAGPVGWIGPDAAEFAVAIRSGLVEKEALTLFSGAGIVDGSVPEQEWAEIEQKIADFAAVMGLGVHSTDASAQSG